MGFPKETFVAVDIETAPTRDAKHIQRVVSKIKAPSSYKDEEKIAKYIENKAKEAVMETALDATFGHIVAIGVSIDGNVDHSTAIHGNLDEYDSPDQENYVLSKFAKFVDTLFTKDAKSHGRQIVFLGHNILGFDLPFIVRRSIILGNKDVLKLVKKGIIPHPALPPWKVNNVFDTMLEWGKPWPRLKDLAMVLNLLDGSEDDLDGRATLEAFLSGDYKSMLNHVRHDAAISYRVGRHMFQFKV